MPAGPSLLLLLGGPAEPDDPGSPGDGIWQDCLCTDEMLAQRSPSDFDILAPHQERVALGDDGVIAGGGSWGLYSEAVDFEEQGVVDGHVVSLFNRSVAREDQRRDRLGIVSASGHTLTTRRIGQAANFGSPPFPTSGTARVEFAVYSFRSQILNLSNEIRETLDAEGFTVEDAVAAGLLETLEKLCVAWVLRESFADRIAEGAASQGGAAVAGNSQYTVKCRFWTEERDRLLARIYRKLGIDTSDTTSVPTLTTGLIRLNVRGRSNEASGVG